VIFHSVENLPDECFHSYVINVSFMCNQRNDCSGSTDETFTFPIAQRDATRHLHLHLTRYKSFMKIDMENHASLFLYREDIEVRINCQINKVCLNYFLNECLDLMINLNLLSYHNNDNMF